MKTVKMSLDTIQGKLSRAEMKSIMAGSICGYGALEYPYYCTWSGMGMSGGGYVCDIDGMTAEFSVARAMHDEGIQVTRVSCKV